ncbi:T9SS type A sorting domain-containing protein [Marivirga arenosa]|uniref:T9SS type A sorting domain-containing protein n=1 Tax=Marivirga arenosa TaxID=3059076 RepID=A0AA51RCC4_9BACT|nr:T9SS type A sorting domain-containing protein [Marivirga sp. ABR2-2]WMN06229.1 T9SS type A sorting domain-containing protein [Marivirga sp. ABR2-2]
MKKILSLIILATLSLNVFSQSLQNNTYTISGEKLVNGTTSMTVSGSAYSTSPISSGGTILAPGFQSLFRSQNNPVTASIIDSLALVDLYNATNPGDTAWISATGWLTAPLADWQGVSLGPTGRVEEVWLADNNLTGTMPESIKNLDSLKRFYFWNNPSLEGNLFDILVNFSALERASAHDCAFTGPILPEIFRPGLLELRLFNNQITGPIPTEIGNAPDLQQFHFANNQLSGPIPNTIGNLDLLTELNLSQNDSISGTIPPEIGQMELLTFLFLENCSLSGAIPAEILNAPSLVELWISGNDFSGTLPDVLNMPNFRALHAGGNRNLLVDLPDNLGELTQLEVLIIWNTRPNGGPFPEGVYNLTNLRDLDLSEQRFTGSIDDRIGNLTNLFSLYLRNNLLSGAFPIEITNAAELQTLDLRGNSFNFLPDISSLSGLNFVFLDRNNFQFESLLPYVGTTVDFSYAPQNPIGAQQDIDVTIGGSTTIESAINNEADAEYIWIQNGDSLTSQIDINLTIDNYNTAKSGRYVLRSTHPSLPDLVLNSAPINLKIQGGRRNWYVDNRAGTIADFRSLFQAVAATKAGDTLYIAGSNEIYGGVIIDGARVLIGPGYFLAENPNTQFNTQAANIDFIDLSFAAAGTEVYGISSRLLRLNNQSSAAPDTLKNVRIVGNRIRQLSLGDKNDGIDVERNYIGRFEFTATSVQNVFRSYDNINASNNIIDTVKTFFDVINSSRNGLNNVVFNYNNIRVINDSINDVSFTNNIIGNQGSGSNTFSGNIAYNAGLFTNGSGSFTIDNDFVPVDAALPQGAFAGTNPYQLSGLPPVPSIYNITIGTRLSAAVSVKSNSSENIQRIRYLYRRNNASSTPFNVRGFTPADDIQIEFLPNRSSIEPNQTYNLVFQAVDESGKRSHRTYIPYETIAGNVSGSVVDIENINVNTGNVRLFAINPFANKYDTAAVQALGGANTFNFENLILGDYIILADPDPVDYPDLIPTYLGNTLDWQLADTLFLETSVSDIIIEVEKEPAPLTEPGSEIAGFLEEEFEEADSTLRALPRRRVSGAGVSVRRLTGSSRNTNGSLRLIENNYVLVAYLKTNEDGEFVFPNLPSGDYRIRIEYPGVEVDEATDIDFNLSGQQGEVVSVEAVVEDGKITVTETGRVTANEPNKKVSFSFYPNPARDELTLKLKNSATSNEILIYDVKGVLHKRMKLIEGENKFSISDLAVGTYIIQIKDDAGNYMMSKMIKQ